MRVRSRACAQPCVCAVVRVRSHACDCGTRFDPGVPWRGHPPGFSPGVTHMWGSMWHANRTSASTRSEKARSCFSVRRKRMDRRLGSQGHAEARRGHAGTRRGTQRHAEARRGTQGHAGTRRDTQGHAGTRRDAASVLSGVCAAHLSAFAHLEVKSVEDQAAVHDEQDCVGRLAGPDQGRGRPLDLHDLGHLGDRLRFVLLEAATLHQHRRQVAAYACARVRRGGVVDPADLAALVHALAGAARVVDLLDERRLPEHREDLPADLRLEREQLRHIGA